MHRMPQFQPRPCRELLGFVDAVVEAFGFLTKEYAFHRARAEVTFVRYESPCVFVNVFHGRGSYEIGVEIGRMATLSQAEECFTLIDILDFLSVQGLEGYAAVDREQVRRRTFQVAELVRKHTGPVLKWDCDFIERLRKARSEWSDNYVRQMKLGSIREKIERAWHAKDYAQVAYLYGLVREDELTGSEAKKLAYARKKLGCIHPASSKS